jgi:hypothetical protein
MQPGPSNNSPDGEPVRPCQEKDTSTKDPQAQLPPLVHHVHHSGTACLQVPELLNSHSLANSSSTVVTDPPQVPYRTSMAWYRPGMRTSTCPPIPASPAEPCTAGQLKHATTSMRAASISRFLQQTRPAACPAGPPVCSLHQADQPRGECDVHAPSSGAIAAQADRGATAGQQADMPHYWRCMRRKVTRHCTDTRQPCLFSTA